MYIEFQKYKSALWYGCRFYLYSLLLRQGLQSYPFRIALQHSVPFQFKLQSGFSSKTKQKFFCMMWVLSETLPNKVKVTILPGRHKITQTRTAWIRTWWDLNQFQQRFSSAFLEWPFALSIELSRCIIQRWFYSKNWSRTWRLPATLLGFSVFYMEGQRPRFQYVQVHISFRQISILRVSIFSKSFVLNKSFIFLRFSVDSAKLRIWSVSWRSVKQRRIWTLAHFQLVLLTQRFQMTCLKSKK